LAYPVYANKNVLNCELPGYLANVEQKTQTVGPNQDGTRQRSVE